jgi:hypothetical protein
MLITDQYNAAKSPIQAMLHRLIIDPIYDTVDSSYVRMYFIRRKSTLLLIDLEERA